VARRIQRIAERVDRCSFNRSLTRFVDGDLKVYGIGNLRIADASIMPRVTTGNTMAPCVIIGERAAALIRDEHLIAPDRPAAQVNRDV